MSRTIDNGAGEQITWLHRDDALLEFELTVRSDAGSPPPHVHPTRSSASRRIAGRLEIMIGREIHAAAR